MVDHLYTPPPWRLDSAEARAALYRWWLRDPLLGLKDWLPHQALRLLPSDTVSALGARLSWDQEKRRPLSSDRARALLRHLRPEADEAEIARLLRSHWRHLGRTLAEFSALPRFWREGRIEVAGREHLDAARASGRPLLFAGIHVGSWEALHAGLAGLGLRFHGIYQRLPNRFTMRIAHRVRQRIWRDGVTGVPLAPTRTAMFEAHRLLERREAALLYYVDEFWEQRVHAPALGRESIIAGNIARAVRLASITGAVVLPCYALRLGEAARFRLTFLPEVAIGRPDRGRAGTLADIVALDAAVETVVRAHPEQWLMLNVFRRDR